MKFKVTFARIVNEAQLVEALIEAEDEEDARVKLEQGDFKRFLVVKRDAREVTSVGQPDFKSIT